MARRRPADGLLGLLVRLPWWVSVVLAAVSYLVASALASRGVDPSRPLTAVVNGLATGGRVVLPILFLACAAASAIGRAWRRDLFDRASGGAGPQAIDQMSWEAFEALLGEAYRRQGYRVVETGMGGADGGIDLALIRDGARTLVQCKHWKAGKVGVTVVRELLGVMTAEKAAAGIVVTSGRFTEEAQRFARTSGIELVDGAALRSMLAEVRRASPSPRTSGEKPPVSVPANAPADAAATPACPACAKPMVRRVAGKGANAGQPFWGCTAFPRCRGTRAIAGHGRP
jgi:restriction system protein